MALIDSNPQSRHHRICRCHRPNFVSHRSLEAYDMTLSIYIWLSGCPQLGMWFELLTIGVVVEVQHQGTVENLAGYDGYNVDRQWGTAGHTWSEDGEYFWRRCRCPTSIVDRQWGVEEVFSMLDAPKESLRSNTGFHQTRPLVFQVPFCFEGLLSVFRGFVRLLNFTLILIRLYWLAKESPDPGISGIAMARKQSTDLQWAAQGFLWWILDSRKMNSNAVLSFWVSLWIHLRVAWFQGAGFATSFLTFRINFIEIGSSPD